MRGTFARNGSGYVASPGTPRHSRTALSFGDVGGTRLATLSDGEATPTFEPADHTGARYAVRTVRTPSRELVFDYVDTKLATVS